MAELSEESILKELKSRLDKLLQEEADAEFKKATRDILIQKTRLAIDAFSNVAISTGGQDNSNGSSTAVFKYPKDKPWKERIVSYMKFYNKGISMNQIVTAFMKFEPDYQPDKLHGAVSNVISNLVKDGVIRTFKPTDKKMKGFFYASPSWFDANNNIMEQHKPQIKSISIWEN